MSFKSSYHTQFPEMMQNCAHHRVFMIHNRLDSGKARGPFLLEYLRKCINHCMMYSILVQQYLIRENQWESVFLQMLCMYVVKYIGFELELEIELWENNFGIPWSSWLIYHIMTVTLIVQPAPSWMSGVSTILFLSKLAKTITFSVPTKISWYLRTFQANMKNTSFWDQPCKVFFESFQWEKWGNYTSKKLHDTYAR